jgi:ATP-dependent DNA helicase RecG
MISKKYSPFTPARNLTLPLTNLKGVGPRRAELLARKGLHTILDLLYFTPIRYEDRTRITPIHRIKEGERVLAKGRVTQGKEERFPKSRKRLFRIRIVDGKKSLELLWFRYKKPHLLRYARPGTELMAFGTLGVNGGKRQMIHPEIILLNHQGSFDACGFYAVYSHIQEISNKTLRTIIRAALDQYGPDLMDPVPEGLLARFGLPGLRESIEAVHFPTGEASMKELCQSETIAHKRLLFDKFFYTMMTMAYRKEARKKTTIPVSRRPENMISQAEGFFHFTLTSDQLRAVEAIASDLSSGRPMNRLLIGDVGTGKTAVAAVAAYIIVQNKRQAAIMAPTQILARQHMDFFSGLPDQMGFRPVLMTGDLKRPEREAAYSKIKSGRYNLVLGTHALVQEGLVFADLGLAVVDEQHRFGVRQRTLMDRKGNDPHNLVMTATPIPRSLAIAIYGDTDVSMMREFPEGHIPVRTLIVSEEQKRWALEELTGRMSRGQQAFVLCPVIEETEEMDLKSAQEMERRLRKILCPPFRVGLIHGRLSPGQKETVMRDFRDGRIDLLVGTTVIEVGVHVPNATVMIIEHPERFGLAQLHQLRGRVGRGREGGICLLMISNNLPESVVSRIRILTESHDGSEIAQKDLMLRGHGEFTGTKQSGVGELDMMEMMREQDLLLKAKEAAHGLIRDDPELSRHENRLLRIMMESVSGINLSP